MKILLSLFLLCISCSFSCADTIYLTNGRSINGIILSDDGETVELNVSSGAVKFLKSEIKNIEKSSTQDIQALRKKWETDKLKLQDRLAKQQVEEERKPRSVEFSHGLQGIIVNVLLDGKVEAKMVLDTGASVMIITKDVANKLKIGLDRLGPDMQAQVADGRQINAKRIVINKVEVQGVGARNVEAAVLLDDSGNLGFGDGLLGMSFLKRFNFKVDQKQKKLILEKF